MDVRRAGPAQVPAIRTVLARALAGDPLFAWFFPRGREPEERRLSRIALYLAPQIDWMVAASTAHVALTGGDVVGAALWLDPDLTRPDTLPAMDDLAEILMDGPTARASRSGMRAARDGAPRVEGDYLAMLAVVPDMQGRGVGSRLLAPALGRGPGTRWLETTNPRNIPFSERAGFRVIHDAQINDSGVRLIRMAGEF